MAGQAKENLPGGCLKYKFVDLKVRIFSCSYCTVYLDINGWLLNNFVSFSMEDF
jgi:hypothetical protein